MIGCITRYSMIGSTLKSPTLDRHFSRFTRTLVFNFSSQNITLHGTIQWTAIPEKMLVMPCCHSHNKLVFRMSSLPIITKMFQDKAPSGIKSAVIRTYATCSRSHAAIDRMSLKYHGERYYGYTRKILSIRVCQKDCFPIS